MTAPGESEASDEVPESPDLGASVQLESGETLDGPPGTDGLDAGVVAPERPFFLDDPDTTPAGQRERGSIDDRLQREIPDDAPDAASGPPPDVVEGEIASEAGQGRSGRLVSDVTALDTEPDDTFQAQDAGISGGAASAEEAAVHDIDEDEVSSVGEVAETFDGDVPEGPEVRLRDQDVDPTSGVPGESL